MHGAVSTNHSIINICKATEHATGLTGKKKESMKNQDGISCVFLWVFLIFLWVHFLSFTCLLKYCVIGQYILLHRQHNHFYISHTSNRCCHSWLGCASSCHSLVSTIILSERVVMLDNLKTISSPM